MSRPSIGYARAMDPRRSLAPASLLVVSVACSGGTGDAGTASESASTSTSTSTSTGSTGSAGGSSTGGGESTGSGGESSTSGTTGGPPEPEVMTLMEGVIFYDGYAGTVDEPVPAGILRHTNALVATRFDDAMLAKVQETMKVGVIIGARCDNYDRIGSVNLAMVPKGAQSYVPAEVERIEVARFITPFMDMNRSPKTVPYEWDAPNLVPILKDPELRAAYDFWWELSVFGVPYAAQKEVSGCAGRIDTQAGTLLLYTDSMAPAQEFGVLLPLAIGADFNNYAEGASDMIGTTRKTIPFALPAASEEAQLVLITSNHGANDGGEEYIRRDHFVYVDGAEVHSYKPGRTSCEPFRYYNTQGNGIYGQKPRSDAEWQSFSNWCPGDVIDTRVIPLGAMAAGEHEFVIDVPDAAFVGGQGNFPLSLYVQAR